MGGAHDHEIPVAATGGFLERRDARAKVLVALGLVLATVLSPAEWPRLLALGGLALIFVSLGATSPLRVLARAAVVLPFALVGSAFFAILEPDGLKRLYEVVARAAISGVAVSVLGSSTELPDLVRALGSLGVPRAVIVTMSFTLRYVVLLREEGKRLMLARELRTFGWRPALALRAMGHSVGTLFVRTFERAERVHAAMAARGFTGSFPTLVASRFGALDAALVLLLLGAALTVDLLKDR